MIVAANSYTVLHASTAVSAVHSLPSHSLRESCWCHSFTDEESKVDIVNNLPMIMHLVSGRVGIKIPGMAQTWSF